ncbi:MULTISPECIES: helix-turn-helix domain-containing protein [unclassified Sphingobium]|uniref:helix-turn-helix domain-containing protein n=1 Tax=unclassified Sphingobium TaxID=2611147 RepID=UPI002224CAF4|nr:MULTISPECIES: helix-turn-helix domain-containing protein [unclassified Sphingobium]MCW2381055.1 AraC-like DNA-binding protein [Sphingobium sp. B2D3B]MCW2398838.1 AraC-like DNA-binding protein [Sphingobium sp. B2D3C]
MHIFTTKASSRVERSRQWCAVTQAPHIEFADDREASLRGGDFGALRFCIVSLGSHRLVLPDMADRRSPPTMKLLFQEEGTARISQGGLYNDVQAGQWCALRKDVPYTIDAPDQCRQLAVTVPCSLLTAPRWSLDRWRKPRSFLRGPAQILHASVSASVMTGNTLRMQDRELLGDQIAHLVNMTIHADDVLTMPDPRESRRRAILEYVDRHLADADLSIARIARDFSMSSRSIHKLFEGEAYTIARAIWDRRLERCREEMVDPALARRSITEIAHLWGFSDSQHFSRAFKQRFGLTPRDYRNLFSLH